MKQDNLMKTVELRHLLHQFPELPLQEKETIKTLMRFLRENTSLEVVDRDSWFYAHYTPKEAKKPTIGFRADIDALPIEEKDDLPYCSVNPGVSHRCGHDGHAAALAGLALALDQRGADRDIYLIFQPAEEIGAGGERCATLIPEKGITQMFAYHNMSGHPLNSIVARRGVSQCASKGLVVTYTGSPAHASQPEDGVNPSNALAATIAKINDLQKNNDYEGLVLATIVCVNAGDMNFGIAAYEGSVAVTLRAYYEKNMNDMEQKIRAFAEDMAKQEGLEVSFSVCDEFPETVNDPDCVQKVEDAAAELGLNFLEMKDALRGSEDFGYYQKKCPGVMYFIGNGTDYAALHTYEYDFNDDILETAVEMFMKIAAL